MCVCLCVCVRVWCVCVCVRVWCVCVCVCVCVPALTWISTEMICLEKMTLLCTEKSGLMHSMSFLAKKMTIKVCPFSHPWVKVSKLFSVVIDCHVMVLQSFCVIKIFYHSSWHRMAVSYHGNMFYKKGTWQKANLNFMIVYFNWRQCRYWDKLPRCFITLAPGPNVIKLITAVIWSLCARVCREY